MSGPHRQNDENDMSLADQAFDERNKMHEELEALRMTLTSTREALRGATERAEALATALGEALDQWSYASEYKGEYLRAKHQDVEDIARLRALLDAAGGKGGG